MFMLQFIKMSKGLKLEVMSLVDIENDERQTVCSMSYTFVYFGADNLIK